MTATDRPALPTDQRNPHLKSILENGAIPQVKYQVLSCQGQDILVGRLKISTPTDSGHAFILRRHDTGAVSLTTMFRAAFPLASEQAEKAEVQYVKDKYNLAGNNGSAREPHITRLAGTWVDPQLALELGKEYGLGEIISRVVNAAPDPNSNYRRSGKKEDSSPPKPLSTKPPSNLAAPSSPTVATPNPSKRRKQSTPPPPVTPQEPMPRRSARTKSPPPKVKASSSLMSVVSKPPSKRATRGVATAVTPSLDEESQEVEDVADKDLHNQDVAEQKQMINDLKQKRNALARSSPERPKSKGKSKRSRPDDEEKLQFDFKEPEIGERAIATNQRIGLLAEPRHKSVAWGVAAFAFGAGVVTLLPNIF